MFCKHVWVKITEVLMPSAFEQANAVEGYTVSAIDGVGMFTKKIVVILACEKCGKLNKTVEVNP